MKKFNTIIVLVLVSLSITIYSIKTLLVGDISGTQKFLFNGLGILPLNILLMTFVFNKLLSFHTRRAQDKKRKMLMNAFFSEFGNSLLRLMTALDPNKENLDKSCNRIELWEDGRVDEIHSCFSGHVTELKVNIAELYEIKDLLNKEHHYMLTLLQHPAMLAHEKFSDLLWALFHLEDELNHRDGNLELPENDMQHLAGDLSRVYSSLISQWVDYIDYLKDHYPYLYSLAIRTSPFKESSEPVIL